MRTRTNHFLSRLARKSLLFCILLLFAAGWQARANDPLAISLDQAIQHASDRNQDILAGRLDIRSAQQQIRETTAIGLPQVSASVGYQYYLDVPISLVPAEFFGGQPGEFAEIQFGTEQNLFATATVNQIIFSGEYIVGLRAARIYRELARFSLQRTELEVRNMVTETYLLTLMTQSNLEIVRENLVNMETTLHQTSQTMEAGFTDPINVDQLKLAVSNLQNSISTLERQVQLTKNLLKFQAGIDMQQEVVLTDKLENLMEQISIDAGMTATFDPELHIDLMLFSTQEAFSRMVLKREQSFFLPSLNASFVRQEMAMRNEFNFLEGGFPWFPSTYFSVNLSIPIFSSGMRSARVQQARIDLEKASLATEQTRQMLIMQMEKALADFQTAVEQYQNQKDNLELARRIYDRTTIMHREGLASSLELTQASDQMESTHLGDLGAMFDVLNARNDLEKAMGR